LKYAKLLWLNQPLRLAYIVVVTSRFLGLRSPITKLKTRQIKKYGVLDEIAKLNSTKVSRYMVYSFYIGFTSCDPYNKTKY